MVVVEYFTKDGMTHSFAKFETLADAHKDIMRHTVCKWGFSAHQYEVSPTTFELERVCFKLGRTVAEYSPTGGIIYVTREALLTTLQSIFAEGNPIPAGMWYAFQEVIK